MKCSLILLPLALSLGALVILFYLMSVVQWREHFG